MLLIRSGYIIVSLYYSVSSYIFLAWLHEAILNSNLYWIPTEEVTDKTSREVAHTVYLCIKGKFERSFSQIKMLFSIIISCLNKKKLFCEGGYCAWFICSYNNAMLGLSEWQKDP